MSINLNEIDFDALNSPVRGSEIEAHTHTRVEIDEIIDSAYRFVKAVADDDLDVVNSFSKRNGLCRTCLADSMVSIVQMVAIGADWETARREQVYARLATDESFLWAFPTQEMRDEAERLGGSAAYPRVPASSSAPGEAIDPRTCPPADLAGPDHEPDDTAANEPDERVEMLDFVTMALAIVNAVRIGDEVVGDLVDSTEDLTFLLYVVASLCASATTMESLGHAAQELLDDVAEQAGWGIEGDVRFKINVVSKRGAPQDVDAVSAEMASSAGTAAPGPVATIKDTSTRSDVDATEGVEEMLGHHASLVSAIDAVNTSRTDTEAFFDFIETVPHPRALLPVFAALCRFATNPASLARAGEVAIASIAEEYGHDVTEDPRFAIDVPPLSGV